MAGLGDSEACCGVGYIGYAGGLDDGDGSAGLRCDTCDFTTGNGASGSYGNECIFGIGCKFNLAGVFGGVGIGL